LTIFLFDTIYKVITDEVYYILFEVSVMKKFLWFVLMSILALNYNATVASMPGGNDNNLPMDENEVPKAPGKFYGTMKGSVEYRTSSLNPTVPTYTRVYRPMGDSNILRRVIDEAGQFGGEGYIDIGNTYYRGGQVSDRLMELYRKERLAGPKLEDFLDSQDELIREGATKSWKSALREHEQETSFRLRATHNHMGGGCFQVLAELKEPDAQLSCYKYALRSYGARLEQLAQKPMNEIIHDPFFNIDGLVRTYFEPVTGEPEAGDLIIYENVEGYSHPGGFLIGTTHAGIYRYGSKGGVVESKWGWVRNPYVFLHDIFFASHAEGTLAKFYQLKETM
jgi:hypothetical protein